MIPFLPFSAFKFKTIAIILVLFVIVGGILFVKHKINSLEKEKVELIEKNTMLANDLRRAIDVNIENQQTIKRLENANKLKEQAERNLKDKMKKDQQTIDNLMERISKVKPEDDGQVANVLKDTVDTIQKQRDDRSKETVK
jgi:cell division protein FtsX